MDGERFDRFVRGAAGLSRRRVLAGLAAALGLAVGPRRAAAQWVGGDAAGQPCGGFVGRPCPPGYACVDDPADSCDPVRGGADCSGVCVREQDPGQDVNPCAAILCIEGTTCCPQCGGVCIPHGAPCDETTCGSVCGGAFCGPGEYCCNESCGICAPIGGGCTEQFCGEPCGATVCGLGEFCCNPSCSICAPIGGACTLQLCTEEPQGVVCGPTVCAPGEVCCNESCGICTPPDGACIALYCGE
jgi:hypothetical protein